MKESGEPPLNFQLHSGKHLPVWWGDLNNDSVTTDTVDIGSRHRRAVVLLAVTQSSQRFWLDPSRELHEGCCQYRLSETHRLICSDVAVNVNSWSECSRLTVRAWIRLLSDLGLRTLFLVLHDEELTTVEAVERRDIFLPELTACGFKLHRKEKKFEHSLVAQYGEDICRFVPVHALRRAHAV